MVNNILLRVLDNKILTWPNFKDWLVNLRITLNFKKTKYILEVPLPIDLALDVAIHEKEVLKTKQEDNLKAQSYMLASINKELQRKHKNMESMYDILKELYSENSRVVEYKLCSTLCEMRLGKWLSTDDNIIKMINILGQLDVYKVIMFEKLKVNLIL